MWHITKIRAFQAVLGQLPLLPALRQAGFKLAASVRTVLYCKGGFHEALRRDAAADPHLELVEGSLVI